uniref:Uncharacterized protein n=2 Tax=viral metagenome TaxID=1070528 RepID=A0A6M3KR55_9ZZZZ
MLKKQFIKLYTMISFSGIPALLYRKAKLKNPFINIIQNQNSEFTNKGIFIFIQGNSAIAVKGMAIRYFIILSFIEN